MTWRDLAVNVDRASAGAQTTFDALEELLPVAALYRPVKGVGTVNSFDLLSRWLDEARVRGLVKPTERYYLGQVVEICEPNYYTTA